MDENRVIEEAYLKKTLALLKIEIERLELRTSGQLVDLEQYGYKMWDEVTHIIRDFDDVVALALYDADITRQELQHRAELRELRNILSLYRIPYFGRLDFISDCDGFEEKVYIGAHSFTDRHTYEPYIYDWRTPIASMYYDSDVGPAKFASPDGEESGQITLMRRYRIRNGKIQLMYDINSGISDDMLGAALTENAHAKLKVIVESIQKEQNRAIRDETAGDLIIFGPAGSGKTSVGLHRFAYLLYRQRDTLSNKNLEIVSRSGIFASYIADILPELGEEDAHCSLFEDILLQLVPEKYDLPDYYEQIEYILSAKPDDVRLAAVRVKSSTDFIAFIPGYFKDFHFKMPDIRAMDQILCSGEELTRRCQEMLETRPFAAVLTHARSYIEMLVTDYYSLHEKELLDKLWHEGNFFGDETQEEFIRRRRRDIDFAEEQIDHENMLDDETLYLRLLKEFTKNMPEGVSICRYTEKTLETGRLEYEDALCLAALRSIIGKIYPKNTVRELLIDEAQDYNAVQHFILKKYYPNAQFTILADPNQAVFSDIGIKSEEELTARYPGSHVIRLTMSYRSTAPINRLAAAVIDGDQSDFFDRDGEMPKLILSANTPSAIAELVNSGTFEGMDTIGIITIDRERAKNIATAVPSAKLYLNSDEELGQGIAIMPAALCKGLEFDAVIADCGSVDRRLLYLFCTRALHKLYLMSENGVPAPLLNAEGLFEAKIVE